MKPQMYLDVHVIQVVPPSNLNRDDAGSPKTAIYGGVRRARVSSQAWKRATRMHFASHLPQETSATRTRRIADLLAGAIAERSGVADEAAVRLAATLLAPLGIRPHRKKDTETSYLLFVGREQVARVAELVAARAGELTSLDDASLREALSEVQVVSELEKAHPAEVALFGRMVADLAQLNVDAAVQVAHGLSTHAVEVEFDYFTAVDDEKDRSQGDDAGAAMIGNVEFNSATLYRYATLGLHQLHDNLSGSGPDVADTARGFVDSFVRSMPSGHSTSFAHRTLPAAVVVVARDDQPVNLVSAFEEPIRSRAGNVAPSVRALATELRSIEERWGGGGTVVGAVYEPGNGNEEVEAFGQALPFPAVLDRVRAVAETWAGSST